MAQQKTAARPRRTKHRPRRFRTPERSLAAAGGLSVLVLLGVAILIAIVLLMTPNSPLRTWYELVAENGSVSQESPLYQQTVADVSRDDALYVSSLSLFCGGLAFGLLAPGRASRRRVLWAAAGIALAVVLACLAPVWLPGLLESHGRLPHLQDPRVWVTAQTATSLGGAAAYVLGAFLARLWRERRRPPSPESEGPSPAPSRETAASR